jgi:hypothetical protein
LDRFSGKLGAIVPEQQELQTIGIVEALQKGGPFWSGGLREFARNNLRDRFEVLSAPAHQQRIETEAKLDFEKYIKDQAQKNQVQEKPAKNFQVEREAQFHRASVRDA